MADDRNDAINLHSHVLMHYSIALLDGTIIESSYEEEPVEISMGQEDVTGGMELALFGLKEGDEQTLTLTPEQGFGLRDESNIHDMPLSDFPDELKPEVGLSYTFEATNGDEIPGTVTALTVDTATVDFNHPLAGQEIVFKVDILGVSNDHAEPGTAS